MLITLSAVLFQAAAITTYMNKDMKTLCYIPLLQKDTQSYKGRGGCLNSTLQLHVSLLINFITLIKGHFIDRCKKNGQNDFVIFMSASVLLHPL